MTYSLVARDPASGELGVAVQSHWFSVGSIVTWARAGVGAVATQSVAEPAYGARLLARLARGEPVAAALAAELAADEVEHFRQVAAVDAAGRGRRAHRRGLHRPCRPGPGRRFRRPGEHDGLAGGLAGDGGGVRARPRGSSRERLLAALEAAEEAGGDVRGRQSAALARGPGAGRALGDGRSTCGSRTRPSRWPSCGGCWPRTTPTRSPTAPTSSPAPAGTSEAAEPLRRGRRRGGAGEPRARLLGRARDRGDRRPRGGRRAGRGGDRGRSGLGASCSPGSSRRSPRPRRRVRERLGI